MNLRNSRKKIEEFRRRRKEAEEYNENSPIKPPKARKTDDYGEPPEMLSVEKSLRHDVVCDALISCDARRKFLLIGMKMLAVPKLFWSSVVQHNFMTVLLDS